jgi:hypothetical protein
VSRSVPRTLPIVSFLVDTGAPNDRLTSEALIALLSSTAVLVGTPDLAAQGVGTTPRAAVVAVTFKGPYTITYLHAYEARRRGVFPNGY